MTDIQWTAREALACALCWSGFSAPEETMKDDTPEKYWIRMPPKTRDVYRREAKARMLLAVARGQAVAILPASGWGDDHLSLVGANAGLKAPHRIWKIINAVYQAAKTITNADVPIHAQPAPSSPPRSALDPTS